MIVDVVAAELDRVHELIAGRFGRAEPRARVREYVSGQVAGLERKNGMAVLDGSLRRMDTNWSGTEGSRSVGHSLTMIAELPQGVGL